MLGFAQFSGIDALRDAVTNSSQLLKLPASLGDLGVSAFRFTSRKVTKARSEDFFPGGTTGKGTVARRARYDFS
jgi:hypothetical protein